MIGEYRPRLQPGRRPPPPSGEIVDAIYSPIRKAAYLVERTRIGQQTDYDKLHLEILDRRHPLPQTMPCAVPQLSWCST
jgi:hypothetical protein